MYTTYTVFSQTRYRLEYLTDYCLLALVFFLPISLPITSFFLMAGTCLWAGKMVCEQKILWKKTPFDRVIALFVLLAGISVFSSVDTGFSFYNYYNLMGQYILTYYLVVNNLKSLEQLKLLVWGLLSSAALVALYGIYQYFYGIDISAFAWVDGDKFPELKTRVFSTLGNPNLLAGFLVITISLSAGLGFYERQPEIKIFLFILTFIAGICLIMTYSRGLWLSVLAVLGVYGKFYNKRIFWTLVPALILLAFGQEMIWARVASILSPADSSAALRLALWESTLAMIVNNPVGGIGWGSYWLVYPKYDFFINDPNVIIYHAHNMYLHLAAEIGLPGLVAFLAIFCGHTRIAYQVFVSAKAKERRTAGLMMGIMAAFAGLGVSGFTDYVMFNAQLSTLFWLLNAMIIAAWQIHESK